MKKAIAILLGAAMMLSAAALAGCGGNDTSSSAGSGAEEATTEAAASVETLTIDNHAGTVMSLDYPAEFTYNADYIADNPLGQNLETRCGALEGDYTIAFCFSSIYTNAYENIEAYFKQFKSNPIYDELDLDGHKTYVRQSGESHLALLIAYSDTEMIILDVSKDGAATEDYKTFYEGDAFQAMLKSVRFEGGAAAASITTEEGYLTVTPTSGWYQTDAKTAKSVTLANDKISSVTYVNIEDLQLSPVDKLKEYILTGYSDYAFETQTIGSNSFEVLDAGSVVYLVAETSTGKGVQIELRNCTVDDARELLETIEIK